MKIDFFIIGTQKSGTTTLHQLLSSSEDITTHFSEEFTVFYDESRPFSETNLKKYFPRNTRHKSIIAKHSSACYHLHEIKRAYQHNPEIRFIISFRNPIHRIYSSYLMERNRSLYPYDFPTMLTKALSDIHSMERKIFLSYGCYDIVINNLFKIIPEKCLHIVLFEKLIENPTKVANAILSKYHLKNIPEESPTRTHFNQLKKPISRRILKTINHLKQSSFKHHIKKALPAMIWYTFVKNVKNTLYVPYEEYPSIREEIDPESYQKLLNYYGPHVENFEKITGLNTGWFQAAKQMRE